MPEISRERILELQQIIKEDHNKEISFKEADEIARNLVGYFDLLARLEVKDKNSE